MTFTQHTGSSHIGVMSEALLTKLPVTVVPKDPSVGVSAQKIDFSGFDLMHKQMILC